MSTEIQSNLTSQMLEAIEEDLKTSVHSISDESFSRIERAGSPHDAVGRFCRTVLESETIPDVPGGVPFKALWYWSNTPR